LTVLGSCLLVDRLLPLSLLWMQIWVFDGQNRVLDKIIGRRKKRRSFEYEVRWLEMEKSVVCRACILDGGLKWRVNQAHSPLPACPFLPVLSQIQWVGLSSICFNKWITREELVERGFEKMINEYDGKLAAEQKV
jgi:hypothetical protein